MTKQEKKISFWIIVLVLITFAKGLLWVFIVPIFQAPDEPQHYSYVQYLAEKKSIPTTKILYFQPSQRLEKQMELLETEQIAHNAHIQHSYYRQAGDTAPNQLLQQAEALNPTPSEYNYIHNYGPLYYLLNLPFYWLFNPNLALQIYSMRIFSVLLSCITVALAFLTCKKIPVLKGKSALAVALFISFLPQFSHISASINNDNLIVLLFTLFFYMATKWFAEPLNLKRILLIFLVASLALITKTQGVILLVISLLYILSKTRVVYLLKTHRKSLFATAFVTLAGTLILLPQIFQQYFSQHSVLWFLKTITVTRILRSYKSFVGRFGWLDTLLPQWAYIGFAVLIMLALIGLVVWFYKKHQQKESSIKIAIAACTAAIITDITYAILFARNAITMEYYNFPTQGRYYFIVILPLVALMFMGLKQLSKTNYLSLLAVGFVIALNLVSILAIIPIRYYV